MIMIKDNYNMMHKYSSIDYLIMSLLNLNKKWLKMSVSSQERAILLQV